MMKLVTVVLVIMILIVSYAVIFCTPKEEFYYMTSTGYSLNCICEEYNDGFTATMTEVREGIVAVNVDWIDDKWQVRSPLKLGQKIYIEGMGYFSVEDTGPFTERNYHFDFWNLDIFYDKDQDAKEHGIKRIKVFVLKKGEH